MKRLILVDACNLLHCLPAYRKRFKEGADVLAAQLLNELKPLHDMEEWELHVVVDGKGPTLDQQFLDDSRTLSLIFSPAGQSADMVIETWLLKLGPEWTVRVATEDRAILHTALSRGAETFSASELIHWVERVQARFNARQSNLTKDPSARFGNTLDGLL